MTETRSDAMREPTKEEVEAATKAYLQTVSTLPGCWETSIRAALLAASHVREGTETRSDVMREALWLLQLLNQNGGLGQDIHKQMRTTIPKLSAALQSAPAGDTHPDPDIQFQRDHALAMARQAGWLEGFKAAKVHFGESALAAARVREPLSLGEEANEIMRAVDRIESVRETRSDMREALVQMLGMFGNPRPDEYIDGGPSYRMACRVVAQARAALPSTPAEGVHPDPWLEGFKAAKVHFGESAPPINAGEGPGPATKRITSPSESPRGGPAPAGEDVCNDDLINHIARALFDSQWRANSWETTSESFRADCRNMARAVIVALRSAPSPVTPAAESEVMPPEHRERASRETRASDARPQQDCTTASVAAVTPAGGEVEIAQIIKTALAPAHEEREEPLDEDFLAAARAILAHLFQSPRDEWRKGVEAAAKVADGHVVHDAYWDTSYWGNQCAEQIAGLIRALLSPPEDKTS